MTQVRALAEGFDGSQRRKKDAVFEIDEAKVAYAEKRSAASKAYRPWFVRVGAAPAKAPKNFRKVVKAGANEIA